MDKQKLTKIFVFAMILLIGAFDVWTISAHGVESSISQTLIDWSYKYPMFTFLMGFTMGHLFWKISSDKKQ